MKPKEFARRLPALVARYSEVLELMDGRLGTERPLKVSHRAVLDEYLATRNYSQTARAFGISNNMVWLVVYKALRLAEALADMGNAPKMRASRIRRLKERAGPRWSRTDAGV